MVGIEVTNLARIVGVLTVGDTSKETEKNGYVDIHLIIIRKGSFVYIIEMIYIKYR